MGKLAPLYWIITSFLFALSFATVTGIINPQEINAIWIVVAAATFYAIAYRYYGAFLSAKVLALNDLSITPAYRLNDGRNGTTGIYLRISDPVNSVDFHHSIQVTIR